MYVVVGRIAMLVVAACCAAAVNAVTVNSAAAEQSATEAEYLASITHLREQTIKEGMIYGDTLLRFDKIDVYVEHFRAFGINVTDVYERASDIDHQARLTHNLRVMVGDIVDTEQIAALFIGKQKAEGTYVQPAEKHMQLYHEFIFDKHSVWTSTASAELDEILGDLAVVAPQVLQMREDEPKPTPELHDTNPEYWGCFRHGYEYDWETGECSGEYPIFPMTVRAPDEATTGPPAPVEFSAVIFVKECNGMKDDDRWIVNVEGVQPDGHQEIGVLIRYCNDYGPEHLKGLFMSTILGSGAVNIPDGYEADGAQVDARPLIMCGIDDEKRIATSTGEAHVFTVNELEKEGTHMDCHYGNGNIIVQAWKIAAPVSITNVIPTLNDVSVFWNAHGAATEGYDIVLVRDSNGKEIHTDSTTTRKTITGLTKGTDYTVKVSVKGVDNTEGTREFSTIGPVRNLLVHSITQNSASAYWDAHTWHNKGYKIELWQDGDPDKTPDTFEQNVTSIGLAGLTPDTRHIIKVGIQGEAGTEAVAMFATGGDTSPVTVQPVTGVTASAVWKYVTVSWDQHPDYANPTYRVEVRYDNGTTERTVDTTSTTTRFFLQTHDYEIRVGIKDMPGTWSESVSISVYRQQFRALQ